MIRQKRGPRVAVQHDAGTPQFENFAQAPQKAHFNLSKSIAKPFVNSGMTSYAMGVVPLKSLQFGSVQYQNENFTAEKLKTIQPSLVRVNMETSLFTVEIPDAPDFEINLGIRPGRRLLNAVL